MKAAIVIAPKEFRDETVARAKMMFQKWGVTPVIVGLVPRECVGSHGAVYMPDINLNKLRAADFDAIFLVDGAGVDAYKLYELTPLLDLLREFNENGKIIAGVGNAMKVIARSNIVAGKKISVPKDPEIDRFVRLYKGVVSQEDMEWGTNIMSLKDYTKTDEFVGRILDKLGAR